MWAKISETKDMISYKQSAKNMTIIIEARLVNGSWRIFKSYQVKGMNKLIQEYTAMTRNEAVSLIEDLKNEKDLSISEIQSLSKINKKAITLNLRREYKEYEVEKWHFSINDHGIHNAVIIRYAEEVIVDIVLHQHYRPDEQRILSKLFSNLNLKDIGSVIKENIYYFSDERHHSEGEGILVGKVEMDFDPQ